MMTIVVLLDLDCSPRLDQAKSDLDVPDDVLAEDEGVGHHRAEHEHDAGQDPERKCRYSLNKYFYKKIFKNLGDMVMK